MDTTRELREAGVNHGLNPNAGPGKDRSATVTKATGS